MAERLRTLIVNWTFDASDRVECLVSDPDKVVVDQKAHVARLRADAAGKFPLDENIYIVGRRRALAKLRGWLNYFEASVRHKKVNGVQVTSAGFRLHDGTDQWWWNADEELWEKSTSDWSSEQEIADHLSTFPIDTKIVAPVVNLRTTDASVTPELVEVRLPHLSKVDSFLRDIVVDSLVPVLKASVRPIMDFSWPKDGAAKWAGGTTLDFKDLLAKTGMKLKAVGMDGIYNHTTDPLHENNLLDSYDVGTQVASLTEEIPEGNVPFVQAIYEPSVAVWARHQDYATLERTPSIVISQTESADNGLQGSMSSLSVANKGAKKAIVLATPYRSTLRLGMICTEPGVGDECRLADALSEFFESNPVLESVGTGERYRMQQRAPFEDLTTGDEPNELRTFTSRFDIADVLAFTGQPREEPLVTGAALTGSMSGSTG